jgi:phosphatidylglycerophosphate synthase
MFDRSLRVWKDRLLRPVAQVFGSVPPTALTVASLVVGLGSAGVAALGGNLAALVLWLVNRVLDGADGFVARATGKTSDLGGYLDLEFDFVVYAAIPLGLAWAAGSPAVWVATAVLLATYYVNAVSWLTLSALEEKRRPGTADPTTTLPMPRGPMEGFETIVLYAAFFLWTPGLVWLLGAGAVLVLVSAGQRVVWALRGGVSR